MAEDYPYRPRPDEIITPLDPYRRLRPEPDGIMTAQVYSCPDGSFSTSPCGESTARIHTPLTATVLPNGQTVITHAPATANATTSNALAGLEGLLDGDIFGIDKKLIILAAIAYFVFMKK